MSACMGGGYIGQQLQMCSGGMEMQPHPQPNVGVAGGAAQEELPQVVQRLFAAYEHQPCVQVSGALCEGPGNLVRQGMLAAADSQLDSRSRIPQIWPVQKADGVGLVGRAPEPYRFCLYRCAPPSCSFSGLGAIVDLPNSDAQDALSSREYMPEVDKLQISAQDTSST